MMTKNAIKKEYTKEGMKLTHPSGYTHVLKLKDLNQVKLALENIEAMFENSIKEIQKDIDAVAKEAV